MLPRIIPLLLLKDGGLVKTVNFRSPNYIGDPINAVRIFNEKEVDEIIILDIDISSNRKEPNYDLLYEIVSESFMPVGYGGGIKSSEQIKKIFDIGVEKVILNTNSFNYDLISSAAAKYGSQSIVTSIDVKKNIYRKYNIYINGGRDKCKQLLEEHLIKVVEAGSGEIIIQSIDDEGKMKGLDIELLKLVSTMVNVPVVASGGVGSLEHIRDAILIGGATAIAAGSFFIYKGKHNAVLLNYPSSSQIKRLFDGK